MASYKKLGLVEEAFRDLKSAQLEVRPVYHKTHDRIRSHVFLGTLAYSLQWHLKQRLEPLFAADSTDKDRQWTVRNVIEHLTRSAATTSSGRSSRLGGPAGRLCHTEKLWQLFEKDIGGAQEICIFLSHW